MLADLERSGLGAVENEVVGRLYLLRVAARKLTRRRGSDDEEGDEQSAHYFLDANKASPFLQPMRSATSAGRSASQPRAHTACSGT